MKGDLMTFEVGIKIDGESSTGYEEEILLVEGQSIYDALRSGMAKWYRNGSSNRTSDGVRVRSELRGRGLFPFVVVCTVEGNNLLKNLRLYNDSRRGILFDYQQPTVFSRNCLEIYSKVFPEVAFSGCILVTLRIQGKTFDLSRLQIGNHELLGYKLGESVLGVLDDIQDTDDETWSKRLLYAYSRNMVGLLYQFFQAQSFHTRFRPSSFPSFEEFCRVQLIE